MTSPARITKFLEEFMPRMDSPAQFLGDEPNAVRVPWESASVRVCIFACWGYVQAAGNLAIPTVYQTINEHREDFLCDRWYLPATPRDLRMFESNGIPVFGIESRHELLDFDVVGTSISYPVLSINLIKQLNMSGIPAMREDWTDLAGNRHTGRAAAPEKYPMVLVGGQVYSAPEVVSNVADVIFAGEAEDEGGNPGLGAVLERIDAMKKHGLWFTDRMECYRRLAVEFNFLYFPALVDMHYAYEVRETVERELPNYGYASPAAPSKQVVGMTTAVPGLSLVTRKRFVRDLDQAKMLTRPPVLYGDNMSNAGGSESSRGCPAWCVAGTERIFVEGRGLVSLSEWSGQHRHPGEFGLAAEHTAPSMSVSQRGGWTTPATCVVSNGRQRVLRIRTQQGHYIDVTPNHEVEIHTRRSGKLSRGEPAWRRADQLRVGDVFPVNYGQRAEGPYQQAGGTKIDEETAWMLGLFVGDGGWTQHGSVPFFTALEGDGIEIRSREWAKETFGWQPSTQRPKTDERVVIDRYSCQALRDFLSELGFAPGKATPDSKLHVPEHVFQSPLSVQKAFVLGLLEADGDVDVNGYYVQLTSVSERLVRDVAQLLLNIGHRVTWQKRSTHSTTSLAAKAGSNLQDVYLLRIRPTPGADLSWMEFMSGRKAELLPQFIERELDTRNNVNGWALSKTSMPAKIVSVEELPATEVFDLAVPNGHAFDASGFTVHNCGFCRLSWSTKPFRQRSVEKFTEQVAEQFKYTGSYEVSPFGPDFPMQTNKKRLISSVLENVSEGVNASSLRIDDAIADPQFMVLQAHGGMKSITLGLEGNSQRMRDLVGKGCTDAEVEEALVRGIAAGIGKFKLYMISSFPGEEKSDIEAIVRLARRLVEVRDAMGSKAVLKFSWTPLVMEGGTPFQWFAPTHVDLSLIDSWNELLTLGIDVQFGQKAQRDKFAYYQLTQRASREVGKAMCEAAASMDVACWGGAPRGLYEAVEGRLRANGFLNAYADVFDERSRADMFGWENIDTGVNPSLLWDTYVKMAGFIASTDAETYDSQVGGDYRGSEFVPRCDERCSGTACGVCDKKDLEIRRGYLREAELEDEVDIAGLKVLDQSTVATKVRLRVVKSASHRVVMNNHFRTALRRAFYLVDAPIASRSVRFASDGLKFKDYTCGVDYAEVAFTKRLSKGEIEGFVSGLGEHLGPALSVSSWQQVESTAPALRTEVDASWWRVTVDKSLADVKAAVRSWESSDRVPLVLHEEVGGSVQRTEVNGKDYVDALFVVREGHRLVLWCMTKGKVTPYQVYAALFGLTSWVGAASQVAERVDAYVEADVQVVDLFRTSCSECGVTTPVNVFGEAREVCWVCWGESHPALVAGWSRVAR